MKYRTKTGTYTADGQKRLYYLPHYTELFDSMMLGKWASDDKSDDDIELITGTVVSGDDQHDRLGLEAASYGFHIESDCDGIYLVYIGTGEVDE